MRGLEKKKKDTYNGIQLMEDIRKGIFKSFFYNLAIQISMQSFQHFWIKGFSTFKNKTKQEKHVCA